MDNTFFDEEINGNHVWSLFFKSVRDKQKPIYKLPKFSVNWMHPNFSLRYVPQMQMGTNWAMFTKELGIAEEELNEGRKKKIFTLNEMFKLLKNVSYFIFIFSRKTETWKVSSIKLIGK